MYHSKIWIWAVEANYPVLVRSRDDSMSSAASHILFTKQYAFVPVFPYCVQKLARYTDVQFKAFKTALINRLAQTY